MCFLEFAHLSRHTKEIQTSIFIRRMLSWRFIGERENSENEMPVKIPVIQNSTYQAIYHDPMSRVVSLVCHQIYQSASSDLSLVVDSCVYYLGRRQT